MTKEVEIVKNNEQGLELKLRENKNWGLVLKVK